eukprot:GFUD01051947.1.p1 GENE.GFUD01051947.1~~GFUD01051947.1.p1  ORF type:complete len:103 (-),score=31.04 GFUD01051947.1:72-347(-)
MASLAHQLPVDVLSQTCEEDFTTPNSRIADCLPPTSTGCSKYSSSDLSPSVFCTPSCPPIPLSASTSLLSTTAKKRNKKKLFTEAVGPQEL